MGWLANLFRKNEPGMGVEELARRLKMDPAALRAVAPAYQEIRIPKRNGGTRVLQVPNEQLKTLQRTILRRVLGKLAAHPAAMGFERGLSIASNAAPHVGAKVLVKMDIKDFFTRTTVKRVRAYFVKIGWSGEAADLLASLVTWKGGLPQGAPTSPRLSNLVNYGMDARLFGAAMRYGLVYTRYADDMTFSWRADRSSVLPEASQSKSGNVERTLIATIIQCTKAIIDDSGYVLHQNKKLQIRRRYDRMQVTGVVVNDKLSLPRETRRKLRAVAHRLKTGKPATMSEIQLRGWRALEAMIIAQRCVNGRPA